MRKHDVVVAGDIGCYSLGSFKPLERLDILLCMGGGVSMAHGLDKAGEKRKIVGMVGDSTFFPFWDNWAVEYCFIIKVIPQYLLLIIGLRL